MNLFWRTYLASFCQNWHINRIKYLVLPFTPARKIERMNSELAAR